jgi:hypothetical protein
MKQDPNPIDPKEGVFEMRFAVNGTPFPFPSAMIPKLFVAYVAAIRAEYYAGVDDARNPGCFEQVFHEEVRHAMRDRSEIADWLGNNMDIHTEKADEIGIVLERKS